MSTVAVTLNSGIMPADNWQRSASPEEAAGLLGDTLRDTFLVKDAPCGDPCPSRCSKVTVVREGPYAGATSEGPEYETVYALGSSCGIYDLAAVIAADQLCATCSASTRSRSASPSPSPWSASRSGLLTLEDTGGLDLRFGNAEAMVQLVHDAAFRRGLRREDRPAAAAPWPSEIGHGSEAFAMHAKGMEVGGYDPRGAKGMALVYGCGPRGGCHHAGGYTVTAELTNPTSTASPTRGKAPITLGSRNRRAGAADSAGHLRLPVHRHAGRHAGRADRRRPPVRPFSAADMYLTGERVNTLERVINVREGLRAEDDVAASPAVRRVACRMGRSPARRSTSISCAAEFYAGQRPRPRHHAADRRDAAPARAGVGRRGSGGRRSPEAGGAVSYYRDFREYIAALEADGLRAAHHVADLQGHRADAARAAAVPRAARRAAHRVRVRERHRRDGPQVRRGRSPSACWAPTAPCTPRRSGCAPDEITERWAEVHQNYIEPRLVDDGPVMEEIHVGDDVLEHDGILEFPHPISTPGFDPAPYFTSPFWVTKDPETGDRNIGTYRVMVKGAGRAGMMAHQSQHIGLHLQSARKPAARCSRRRSSSAARRRSGLCSVAKIPFGVDEYAVAGGIAGEPIELVKCQTVDLEVPATAEIVIEGYVDPTYREQEAPFGEYTGYMGTRVANPVFHVTGIMHRKKPVYQAFLSQFPPSESSLIRKLAYDAVYLNRLRSANIPGVLDVQLHEATGSYGLLVIQLKKVHPSQPWQALHAAVALDPTIGKMIVAVDDDIDPNDADAVNWAMAYRMRPAPRHAHRHGQGEHPRPVVGAARGARRRAALPAAGRHVVDPHRRHPQVGLPADLAAAQGVHGQGARALGGRGPAAAEPQEALVRLRARLLDRRGARGRPGGGRRPLPRVGRAPGADT